MESKAAAFVEDFMAKVIAKDPLEKEFHQAVHEVVESLAPFVVQNPIYMKARILDRMAEPERMIIFRVPWVNDRGEVEINRGYRIQMSSAIGPYKRGTSFSRIGKPEYPEVPGFRTGAEEQSDHPSHGRRQRGIRFQSEGEVRH